MKKFAKILSVVLCLAMVVSFAAMAFADENKTQITTLDELTSGNYLIVCDNGANLGVIDGTWVTNAESVWTLTVTDAGVTMKDANGTYLAPKGGNSNGLATKEYAWNVVCNDGMFSFCGTGDDTVTLAFNSSESYLKFRGYKNATVSGENAATYPSTFALYKVSGDHVVETPTTAAPETTVTPVAPAEKLQFTAAPVAGVAYKLGMTQANLNKNLYLSGEMDGYYFATTEDKEAAVDVYVELVEGGMKLYFNKDGVKNYLAIVLNGTYTNVVFNAEGSVFVYNAECNNLVTSVEGTEYYLGTYNNFKTFSASKTSYINAENTGVSQFPAGLVATETPVEPPVVEPTEPEVTEPEVTEPEATEPEVTEPEATEPEATEPEVTEPEVTEPEVTEPEATEPEATEPETTVAPETEAPVATTAPAGSDNDADETGDSSIIVIAVCMMMATAAVVVLVQKKRAF